jgi:YaiO family outer membrane protein
MRFFGNTFVFRASTLVICFFSSSGYTSCTTEDYFLTGKQARLVGDWPLAEQKLLLARQCWPENSDIYVQLGSTFFAEAKLTEAMDMYEQALSMAPEYTDAKYGLIQVAMAADDLEYAERLLNKYRQEAPEDNEFGKLADRLQAIKGAVRLWRLDLHGSHSKLSDNYAPWNDFDFALTRKLNDKSSLTFNYSQAHRFHIDDQKIGATVWHAFTDRFYVYGQGLVSPEKRFFPEYTLSTGGFWRVSQPSSDSVGSFHLNYDIKLERYDIGEIKTLSPGFEQYFYSDRFSFSAKWINSYDQNNKHNGGYMVKAKVLPTPDLTLFLGYSDALETSDKLLIRTRAVFTGLTYQINSDVAINVDYTAEDRRRAYDRDIVGVGVTWSF